MSALGGIIPPVAAPQIALGDRVQERKTCRAGTVVAVCVGTSQVVVEFDDGGALHVAASGRWEPEPDALAVDTGPLAGILTEFVTGWRRDRPMKGSGFRKPDPSDVEPVPALAWLERETGLSRDDLRRAQRPDDNPYTELSVADAIVASIGQPGMFHDGTLTVVPNPRRDCCGGTNENGPL